MLREFVWTLAAIGTLTTLAACGDDGGSEPDAHVVDASADVDSADPGNVSYGARPLIGALDRIVITKADMDLDVCVTLRLVHPGQQGALAITTPMDWSVEQAYFAAPAAGCHDSVDIPQTPEYATAGSGEVTWMTGVGEIYPTVLSVDATLAFPTSPTEVAMSAVDLSL